MIRNTANSSTNGILPYLGLYRTIYHVEGDALIPVDDCSPPSAISDFPGTIFPGKLTFFFIKVQSINDWHRRHTYTKIEIIATNLFYFLEDTLIKGAVTFHLVAAIYFLSVLAIVCGHYFIPSVECICEDLHLSTVITIIFLSFSILTSLNIFRM